MKSPLVSVIVPNYNYARFLRQRIDSILNQTYKNIELILLDDCSMDNSREVINDYKDNSKISHIIFNEINSGSTFKQWKKGFDLARGEFIWIAEADDYADPTFLEKLMDTMSRDELIMVGFANSNWVLPDKMFVNKDYTIKERQKIYGGRLFVREHLMKENYIYNASMAVFRSSALQKVSGEYQSYRSCGDKVFWKELALQGKVLFHCEPLNYFRIHQSKVTTNSIATGLLFEEENRFYHTNIREGFVDWRNRMDIILYFLKYIENTRPDFKTEQVYFQSKELWSRECDYRNPSLPLWFRIQCFFFSNGRYLFHHK